MSILTVKPIHIQTAEIYILCKQKQYYNLFVGFDSENITVKIYCKFIFTVHKIRTYYIIYIYKQHDPSHPRTSNTQTFYTQILIIAHQKPKKKQKQNKTTH